MTMSHHRRPETKAVIWFAKTRIIAATLQLVDRSGVAVGGVKISERIEHQSERIDLAMGEILDVRAVDVHSVGIAGLHRHGLPIRALDRRRIIKSMACIKASIKSTAEIAGHSVRIFVVAKWSIENLLFV